MVKTNKTMELYNKLGTQEKRAVNKLMRGLTDGSIERPELGKICRGITRRCAQSNDEPKKMNDYILYYKERYPAFKAKMPAAGLGDIARYIGAEWKNLSIDEKEKFKQSRQLS